MRFNRGKNFETNGKTAFFDYSPNDNDEVTLLKNLRGDISILLQQPYVRFFASKPRRRPGLMGKVILIRSHRGPLMR